MISRNAERKCAILVALCMAVAVAFAACGGGGNGSSGGAAGGNTATPGGNPTSKTGTSTPTKSKTQGVQGTPTPKPTATGNPTVIVRGDNISSAVHSAPPGSTVIVPPGKYSAFTLSAADLQGPITLLADVTGTLTETSPAPVVVDAALGPAAIALSNIPDASAVVIDGFTLRNGTTAGIVVDNSPGTIIQNCTFELNPGDGVRFSGERFTDAAQSLLFNSLIINNSGAGVHVIGTNPVAIFNNTFYQNDARGIWIGDSANAAVENNIINENQPVGIEVAPDSISGYSGDYNLNYNAGNGSPYSPMSIKGPHDLMEKPQFFAPTLPNPDFHLQPISPAIDAGDPDTPDGMLSLLLEETTQPDCTLDSPPVDLGYHYPTTDPSCPAPTPTPR